MIPSLLHQYVPQAKFKWFSLCSLSYLSCGDVICGMSVICLTTCTTIGTTCINVSTSNGAILPLTTFYAFTSMLSYSLLTPEPKVPPSSTLFFLLRALLGDSTAPFFIFSNVIFISSLIHFTLVSSFYGFSFWGTNRYLKNFGSIKAN